MARRISFEVAEEDKQIETGGASRAPSLSGMARSLQAAAAATVRDIPVDLIEASSLRDRLEMVDEDIDELAAAIREQGQLIPILVSPLPHGRFRIVYGRRRLEALRRLGLPAKALVREMDATQAIIAQGQENSFRKDLSWIEKASFARELIEDGRGDELVCDALNIDQKARRSGEKLTGLSRMKQVTARLSPALIDAVGAAPGVGRDRWYDLSLTMERKDLGPEVQARLTETILSRRTDLDSDQRFDLLEEQVARLLRPQPLSGVKTDAATISQVKSNSRSVTITIQARNQSDLHAWISANPEAALAALEEARQSNQQQGSTE